MYTKINVYIHIWYIYIHDDVCWFTEIIFTGILVSGQLPEFMLSCKSKFLAFLFIFNLFEDAFSLESCCPTTTKGSKEQTKKKNQQQQQQQYLLLNKGLVQENL